MLKKINAVLHGESINEGESEDTKGWAEVKSLTLMCLALGAIYGIFMGLYGLTRSENPTPLQVPASVIKVPLLFLLTLVVTVPSLYVFSTLAGAYLEGRQLIRLMVGSVAMTLAVLASLGPVTGFFTLSTDSHSFMVFLNGMFFAISGGIGVSFLYKSLCRLFGPSTGSARYDDYDDEEDDDEDEIEDEKDSRLKPTGPTPPPMPKYATRDSHEAATKDDSAPTPKKDADKTAGPVARSKQPFRRPARSYEDTRRRAFVLRLWVLMYAIVGAQMSWIMRPLIGDPNEEFTFFSPTESNFFAALRDLIFG